eukprot:scaffold106389_cov27-Tisochrysis_lutea.AAC.1
MALAGANGHHCLLGPALSCPLRSSPTPRAAAHGISAIRHRAPAMPRFGAYRESRCASQRGGGERRDHRGTSDAFDPTPAASSVPGLGFAQRPFLRPEASPCFFGMLGSHASAPF